MGEIYSSEYVMLHVRESNTAAKHLYKKTLNFKFAFSLFLLASLLFSLAFSRLQKVIMQMEKMLIRCERIQKEKFGPMFLRKNKHTYKSILQRRTHPLNVRKPRQLLLQKQIPNNVSDSYIFYSLTLLFFFLYSFVLKQ